jgi:hypothetical protein
VVSTKNIVKIALNMSEKILKSQKKSSNHKFGLLMPKVS